MLVRYFIKQDTDYLRVADFGASYLVARMLVSDTASQALLTGAGAFMSEYFGSRHKDHEKAPAASNSWWMPFN